MPSTKAKQKIAQNYFLQAGKNQTANDSFHGNDFYSYNTQIARMDTERNVLLLSSNRMSATTGASISCLRAEALYNNYKVLPVPCEYGDSTMPDSDTLIKRFEARLFDLSEGTALALADNRLLFMNELRAFREYLDYTGIKINSLKHYEEVENKLNDIDWIKDLQRQRRKKS